MYFEADTLTTPAKSNSELMQLLADNRIITVGTTSKILETVGSHSRMTRSFVCFSPLYVGIKKPVSLSTIAKSAQHRHIGPCLATHAFFLAIQALTNRIWLTSDADRLLVLTNPITYLDATYSLVICKRDGFIAINIQRYDTKVYPLQRMVGLKF